MKTRMDIWRECMETSSHGEEEINMYTEMDEKLKRIGVRNGRNEMVRKKASNDVTENMR